MSHLIGGVRIWPRPTRAPQGSCANQNRIGKLWDIHSSDHFLAVLHLDSIDPDCKIAVPLPHAHLHVSFQISPWGACASNQPRWHRKSGPWNLFARKTDLPKHREHGAWRQNSENAGVPNGAKTWRCPPRRVGDIICSQTYINLPYINWLVIYPSIPIKSH